LGEEADPQIQEISRLLDDDFNNFPLAKYLKESVRVQGVDLFKFSYTMWLPTIALFVVLWALHRYLHMGYIRIMGVAGSLVLLLILGMGWYTKSLVASMQGECGIDSPGRYDSKKEKTIHERVSTENIILAVLEFSLFFVCYGVARMICQPWMWELHFWPVFTLTIVAILSAAVFCFIVAPGIPSFIAVMSIPPYVDPFNKKLMRLVAFDHNTVTPRYADEKHRNRT